MDSKQWDAVLTPKEMDDARTIMILEELNVLENKHEISAEHFDTVLAFFDESFRNGCT